MTSSLPPAAPSDTSVLDLAPVIPVVVLHDVADAVPLARALVAASASAAIANTEGPEIESEDIHDQELRSE
nr:hypothetical protein [Streptomyces sp. ZEA17I]